jgi:GTP-binding protein
MREQLTNLFVLIDSRHEPQQIDLEFMEWLGVSGVPFSIVFTKMDKQSVTRGNANVDAYKEKLLESWEELPPIFLTSSENRLGREELLAYIDGINKDLNS